MLSHSSPSLSVSLAFAVINAFWIVYWARKLNRQPTTCYYIMFAMGVSGFTLALMSAKIALGAFE